MPFEFILVFVLLLLFQTRSMANHGTQTNGFSFLFEKGFALARATFPLQILVAHVPANRDRGGMADIGRTMPSVGAIHTLRFRLAVGVGGCRCRNVRTVVMVTYLRFFVPLLHLRANRNNRYCTAMPARVCVESRLPRFAEARLVGRFVLQSRPGGCPRRR